MRPDGDARLKLLMKRVGAQQAKARCAINDGDDAMAQ
jgi:hypothetical protein